MAHAVRFWIRAPHVSSAAIAFLLAALLSWILFAVFHIEKRLAFLTAPQMLEVKDQGVTLQEEAFGDRHLLPVYGSSEFLDSSPYSGRMFFSDSPTGFEIFVVGKAGAKTLIIAQRIAALGDKVRGRKVVIILSPVWFLAKRESPAFYDGNFSALQASELAFDSPLSPHLKREFATEMLKYPETLVGHGLLQLQLEWLAKKNRSTEDRLLTRLGQSEDHFLQLLDGYQTVFSLSEEIFQHPAGLTVHANHEKPPKPDWDGLLAKASKFSQTNSYEFSEEKGLENDVAEQKLSQKFSGKRGTSFTGMLDDSDEWYHLRILLETLKELGAKPLILSIPINATAFKSQGVTQEQRGFYYSHLRDEVREYKFPVVTCDEYDGDPNFFGDSLGHPSAKGWMTFNKTISQFYHDKLPANLD